VPCLALPACPFSDTRCPSASPHRGTSIAYRIAYRSLSQSIAPQRPVRSRSSSSNNSSSINKQQQQHQQQHLQQPENTAAARPFAKAACSLPSALLPACIPPSLPPSSASRPHPQSSIHTVPSHPAFVAAQKRVVHCIGLRRRVPARPPPPLRTLVLSQTPPTPLAPVRSQPHLTTSPHPNARANCYSPVRSHSLIILPARPPLNLPFLLGPASSHKKVRARCFLPHTTSPARPFPV